MDLNKIRTNYQRYISQLIDEEVTEMWSTWEDIKKVKGAEPVTTLEEMRYSVQQVIAEKEFILNRLN